jgi:hypothetical protein
VSGFVHPGATGLPNLRADRQDHVDPQIFGVDIYPTVLHRAYFDVDGPFDGWATPWWPRSGNLMGGWDGVAENQLMTVAPWWGEPWTRSGCNGRLGFVGYTRDANGSILGGCTVRCFVTSTNELVSQVTSDANGFYIATTPYSTAHYLVVHKTGSPDVAGASVDTLTPA